jgi:pyruvate dehydrogenase E2 component (dihydrolipoyllysine-residue acetyltransferase)
MYTEEGVLTAWLRAAGTQVAAGDPVAEITTEKATFEIPAPETGILHPAVPVGTNLRVEDLMGYILAAGEPAPASAATPMNETPANLEMEHPAPVPRQRPASGGTPRATPVAKRLAAQHAIDLAQVKGSGPGGRIVEADVLTAVALRTTSGDSPSAAPRAGKRVSMAGLRRSLAERLRRTLANAASTTLTREAHADALVSVRRRLAEKLRSAPSYDALFIKLFAAALRERPELNAVIENETIVLLDEVNIGFAVAVPGGLVVPVVRNADLAPFAEISRIVQDLTKRVHAGRLQPADVEGGTATVSNLGGEGVDGFTPILNGAQSAILGVGRIIERPVVRQGSLAIGHTCILSLTFDHRVADGVPAALLLDGVTRRMNDEKFLAELEEK